MFNCFDSLTPGLVDKLKPLVKSQFPTGLKCVTWLAGYLLKMTPEYRMFSLETQLEHSIWKLEVELLV